jgi:hypothetical protein
MLPLALPLAFLQLVLRELAGSVRVCTGNEINRTNASSIVIHGL